MIRSLIGFLFLLCCSLCQAQDPYAIYFDTETGLPSEEVHDVAFDHQGRAWFATDRGLCVYDSYEFETYTTREGLNNNCILQIIEGPDGILWFINLDGTINYLEGDSIHSFSANDSLKKYGYQDRLTLGLAWDAEDRIILWQQQSRDQMEPCFRWEEKEGVWENRSFEELTQEYPGLTVKGSRFLNTGKEFIPEVDLKDWTVTGDGGFYCAMVRHPNKVYFGKLVNPQKVDSLEFPDAVLDVMEDNGSIWVGTSSGLYYFPRGAKGQVSSRYFSGLPISRIGKDPEGNIWLTTLNHGVVMVPSFDFQHPNFADDRLGQEVALRMTPLNDHLVISTLEGGLLAVDSQFRAQRIGGGGFWFNRFRYPVPVERGVFHYPYLIREGAGGLEVEKKDLGFQAQNIVEWTPGVFIHLGYRLYYWRDTTSGEGVKGVSR